MTVIFWTDQKWYEIYVNGQFVCEILAVNKPHAVMKAHHTRAVKASREGRTNECYMMYAKEKGD